MQKTKCADCWRLVELNGNRYCPHMDIKYCPYGLHEAIPPEKRPKERVIPTFRASRIGRFYDRWEAIHVDLIKDYFENLPWKDMEKKYGIPWRSIKGYIHRVFNRQREERQK